MTGYAVGIRHTELTWERAEAKQESGRFRVKPQEADLSWQLGGQRTPRGQAWVPIWALCDLLTTQPLRIFFFLQREIFLCLVLNRIPSNHRL